MTIRIFALAFALVLPMSAGPGLAQDEEELQRLVEERELEEAELQQVPGAEMKLLRQDLVSGKIRLPSGEEVEKLRISQDREVDPETYVVGPGDVMQLYVWGEFDMAYMLQVDPLGNVIVPTIGAFEVSGMFLADAKELVLSAARGKYPGVDITLTLASMRFFTAYVTGAVLQEGSYTVHPTTRVSDMIERAGGFTDELRGTTFQDEVGGKQVTRVRQIIEQITARRSIKLIHLDGTSELVDLDMFLSTGELVHNPYIRMGDVVHVGYRDRAVFIFGAVNQEGEQEYRSGDTIDDLVNLAKGLRRDAPLIRAELWRFRKGTEVAEIIELGSNEKEDSGFAYEDISDVPLQPNDMVFIRARAQWQLMPTVMVVGEVRYRGRYRIYPGITRIKDVVAMAGGLTEESSLIGAKVIRTKMRTQIDPELERLRTLRAVTGLADMSDEDRAYLRTKGREEKGRAAVDFERLFLEDDSEQNIPLESGDVIYIPARRRTISVSGQVRKPGLIDFEPDRDVRYYMEKAGGYTYDADKGGARLIRARTSIREELDNDLPVEAGDEIWVPQKERINYWEAIQSTMRTIAETLTLVVLVRSLQ